MNVRNGYSPEATTLCRLWLDNDEREYRFTQAAIAEAVRNRETREERIIMLAGRLRFTGQRPQKKPDVCPALFVLLECP